MKFSFLTKCFGVIISLLCLSQFVLAEDTMNILPLHTGKTYILDFPVKVSRVVGGDPSAIELNLFKKDSISTENEGYQLLIVPIAEKNTNIIIWTELGLYVFDVSIDNSSEYTAETIINVPKIKKFHVPITSQTGLNVNKDVDESTYKELFVITKDKDNKKQTASGATNTIESQSLDSEIELPLTKPEKKEKKSKKKIKKKKKVEVKANLKEDESKTDEKVLDPKTLENNDSKKEQVASKTTELIEPESLHSEIDLPLVKPAEIEKKFKESGAKEDDSSNEEEALLPKISLPAIEDIDTKIDSESEQKDKNVKPKEIDKIDSAKKVKQAELLKIQIKGQSKLDLDIPPSLEMEAVNILSKPVVKKSKTVKLTITSVEKLGNQLKISFKIKGLSPKCQYILWELTEITENKGYKFLVKNLNLPPGILASGSEIDGTLLAYPERLQTLNYDFTILNLGVVDTLGEKVIDIILFLKG